MANNVIDKNYASEGLGAAHISGGNYGTWFEAAHNAFFTLVITGLDNLMPPETNKAGTETAIDETIAQTAIKLNVTKCPIPHFNVDTGEFRRGNETIKFATTPTWDGGSITVDDTVGSNIKEILLAWQYLAYDPRTGKVGRMAEYKKVATLCEYTQDYELIRSWDLHGIFVTKLDEGEFDKENDGKRQITVNFVYDKATLSQGYKDGFKSHSTTTTTTTTNQN